MCQRHLQRAQVWTALPVPAGQRAGAGYSFRAFPAFHSQGQQHSALVSVTAAAVVDCLLCRVAWGRAEGRALSTWSATSRLHRLGNSPLHLKKEEVGWPLCLCTDLNPILF